MGDFLSRKILIPEGLARIFASSYGSVRHSAWRNVAANCRKRRARTIVAESERIRGNGCAA